MDHGAERGARTEAGTHELLDLVNSEREVGGAQIEHVALRTKSFDAKGERLAREQQNVQPSGALPAEALDEPKRGGRRRQLLGVVYDQHEVVVEGGLERVAQSGGEHLGVGELVVGRGQRRAELPRVGYVRTNRLGDARGERREAEVSCRRCVPGGDDVFRPSGDERRLAVAGSGDHECQALAEHVVEAPLQQRSPHNEGRRRSAPGHVASHDDASVRHEPDAVCSF